MSKVIKQMEMDSLKKTFQGVRDVVVLSIQGLGSTTDNAFRTTLRKKNVRVKIVKNSLTRRVFSELGLGVPVDSPYWIGPTAMAWGANSVAELSRAIDAELKAPKTAPLYKDKIKIKGAIVEGQPIGFEQALTMPTREEAIGGIVAMILGPGSAIAGCLTGPAAQVASQIKTISEKEPAAEAAPAAG
jgi:large subunit ribosomal protein L10